MNPISIGCRSGSGTASKWCRSICGPYFICQHCRLKGDNDTDPDPAQWCGSDPLWIRFRNTGIRHLAAPYWLQPGTLSTWIPVLRIRDVYPGSEFFRPGSWVKKIPDPHQRIRDFLPKKSFIISRKYDPGRFYPWSGSRLRIFIFYPSRIRGQKGTGSGSASLLISCLLVDCAECPGWSTRHHQRSGQQEGKFSFEFSFFSYSNGLLLSIENWLPIVASSVADPDPSDSYVFGPPGSGSVSQKDPDQHLSILN